MIMITMNKNIKIQTDDNDNNDDDDDDAVTGLKTLTRHCLSSPESSRLEIKPILSSSDGTIE